MEESNLFEIMRGSISEFYSKWKENAKINSIHVQTVGLKQNVPTLEEKKVLDYCGNRIREIYRGWRKVNRIN
jgi:hypothetical protein